jgi:two-component system CheB/CheR fusion protein
MSTSNKTKSVVKDSSVLTTIKQKNSFPIVAIGASAGGLSAVIELLRNLPATTGMAFIYVQHLSMDHKSKLQDILSKVTKMNVQYIEDLEQIEPDNFFIVPHNKETTIKDGYIKLIPRAKSTRAVTIDLLFSSLAVIQKERIIGIMLSGSGNDGTLGLKTIKQEGGLTFAQDDSAEFSGMPQSAIESGDIDFVLPPKKIAEELIRISKHPFVKKTIFKTREEDLIDNNDPDLIQILQSLHKSINVDFSSYKMSTVKRRIIRRMLIYKLVTLKEYSKLLIEKDNEIDLLYQDLLINVTSFFREADTYNYLKSTLLPKLLKNKKHGQPLRIWVPACATGEEVYSIAILLSEIQEDKGTNIPIQIFATDLSQKAIAKARLGVYSKQELEGISEQHLRIFFTKSNGDYRIIKPVREMCVFATHNILLDPPFSRLDFISCCNLFIYFDASAQKKVINTFHYALNDNGYLMLGRSETISASIKLFTEFNKTFRIFVSKSDSGARKLPVLSPHITITSTPAENKIAQKKKSSDAIQNLDSAIDAVLVADFMPASVVINYEMEIQQFRGATDLYFTHAPGKASFNILKMARPDIAFELRNAISESTRTKKTAYKKNVEMKVDGRLRIVNIEVVPLHIEWDEPLLLILFSEQEQVEILLESGNDGKNNSVAKDRRIKKLEEELAAARADALALARDQDIINEALQSANEEIMSSNEELQTTNEELATSKEEIESTNEELTTTNQELQTRYEQLQESYDFSEGIIATMHDSMLILYKDLRIKSANSSFYKIFNLNEFEVEGQYLYDIGNKQWNISKLRELLEQIILKKTNIENFEIINTFPVIGEKTLMLNASRIIQTKHHEQLILLAIADVTEMRRKVIEIQMLNNQKKLEETFRTVANTVPALIWMAGTDKLRYFFSKSWLDFTGRTMEQEIGNGWMEGVHSDDLERCLRVYTAAFDKRETFYIEYRLRRHDNEYRWISVKGTPRFSSDLIFEGFTGGCMDIHEQKAFSIELEKKVSIRTKELEQANAEILKSEERYHRMVEDVQEYAMIYLSKEGTIENWNKGAEKIKGYTPEEIIGKKFNVFYTIKDQQNYLPEKLLEQAVEHGTAKHEGWRVRKDGTMFWGYIVITALWDEQKNLIGFSKVTRDLTEKKKTEDQIKETNSQLTNKANQLLEAQQLSHIGSWEWDVQKNKIYWSDELYRIIGLTPNAIEATYDNFSTYIHPDDKQLVTDLITQAFETKQPYNFVHRIIQNDGTERTISARVQIFIDGSGNITRLTGTQQDITEQKKYEKELKESEERLLKIFNNNPIPMMFAEIKTNKIKYANNLFYSAFGYSENEVIGHTSEELKILSPEENKRLITIIMQVLQETRTLEELRSLSPEETEELLIKLKQSDLIKNIEVLYTRKNGKQFPALVSYETIRIGNERYTITSYHDITERKKVEELLKNQNEELAKMNIELKSFAYISSHDLQEPLRKIQTFAGRILEKEYAHLSENGRELFKRMHDAAKRMQALIKDLLDYSRMGNEERVFEHTDLSKIIQEVKEELQEEIQTKSATIKSEVVCHANIIPFQFRQLLYNLISNSLKFAKPYEAPRIEIKSRTSKGSTFNNPQLLPQRNYCHISIADNGIGFEPQYNARIFEVFQRLHGIEKYKGTGIGLAIVKKIVDNHNGFITAEGELNKGATFNIYIPA